MERAINALTKAVMLVGAVLFIWLMFKVPSRGAFKLTIGVFNLFKLAVVALAIAIGFRKPKPDLVMS